MFKRLTLLRLSPEAVLIAGVAFANVALHLVLPEYGYHRDEMYYVAIADGFTFSNLDMPPVAPLYLKLFLMLLGHSVRVVHLAASACGALVIVFGCLIAKEFGGKRYAIMLTGIFLMFSGLVIFGSLYSYDDPSFVVWSGALYVIVRLLKGSDQRLWVVAGILLGIGMLTKLTVLFLGLAIFLSLWLISERRWYARPWIWLGAGIAFLGAFPYMLWQRAHDWYFLSYAATYAGRTTHESPVLDFLWNQVLPNNIALLPVWLAGLALLLFNRQWSRFRFFGYCYLVLCGAIFLLGGQFYFMMPIYAVLAAAGAVWIEQWFAMRSSAERPRLLPKIGVPVAYVLMSLPALPFFVPVLPVDLLIRYVRPIGVNAGVKTEDRQIAELPQHMADRFGWEEMARSVAEVYRQSQSTSHDTVGIVAGNWGEASALHVYRGAFDMPEPISGDGWFYFDALQRQAFRESYVAIGVSRSVLQSVFRHVDRKGVFTHPHCMPDENNNAIYYCTGLKLNLGKYWAVSKRMDSAFENVLRREGVDRAVEFYHERRQQDPDAVLFTERQLNALGYEYLKHSGTGESIALFRLNVEAYPESFNVYDSLGEALMADRQYARALENYTRSVELDPENKNGRKKIEELKVILAMHPG